MPAPRASYGRFHEIRRAVARNGVARAPPSPRPFPHQHKNRAALRVKLLPRPSSQSLEESAGGVNRTHCEDQGDFWLRNARIFFAAISAPFNWTVGHAVCCPSKRGRAGAKKPESSSSCSIN